MHRLNHRISVRQVDEELLRLRGEGVVEVIPLHPKMLPAPITVVPKSNGGVRICLNMRQANGKTSALHFKMENLLVVRDIIRRNDFLTSLDIADAYLHIPVSKAAGRFTCTIWKGAVWRWRALPFGLSEAPRIFTKVMRTPISFLRNQGIRVVAYLDDLLIMAESEEQSVAHTGRVSELLTSLGFTLNLRKSELNPSKVITFLGTVINSVSMSFSLHDSKWKLLKADLRRISEWTHVTARQLAAIVGKLNWTIHMSLIARLRLRPLLRAKLTTLQHASGRWDQPVKMSETSRRAMRWWIDHFAEWNGRPIAPEAAHLTVYSDASDTGWGAVLVLPDQPQIEVKGTWTAASVHLHINIKELLALELGLQRFEGSIADFRKRAHLPAKVVIQWWVDNTVALSHVAKQGGKSVEVSTFSERIVRWTLDKGWVIHPDYIASEENVVADKLSRESQATGNNRLEWKLPAAAFWQAMKVLRFRPDLDLFASQRNAQLPRFVSWKADARAVTNDALRIRINHWGKSPYANPPWNLVGALLHRIQQQRVPTMALVSPFWEHSNPPWWPQWKQMLVSRPIRLPPHLHIAEWPDFSQWKVIIALVSGIGARSADYRRRQRSDYWRPIDLPPKRGTGSW